VRLPTVGVGDVSVSVSTLDVALVPVVDGRNLWTLQGSAGRVGVLT